MANKRPVLQRRIQGISLVEILVAVAIIAILAALVLPQIQRSTEAGKNARCLANLRQLGTGVMLFVADHDGALPPSEEGESSGTYPGPVFGKVVASAGATWAEYIFKTYLDNDPRPLQCPSKPREWTHNSRGLRPDYGINQRLTPVNAASGYRQGMRLAALTRPATTILLGESATPGGQNARTGIYRILSYADLHPRHKGPSVNVLYVDQHAESVKLDFSNPPADDQPLGRNQFVP